MGKRNCCVPRCTSYSGTTDISLHRIPTAKRQQYVDLIQRPNWFPNDNSRICQNHFAADQYEIKFGKRNVDKHQRILKESAIPTIFPHLQAGDESIYNDSNEVSYIFHQKVLGG